MGDIENSAGFSHGEMLGLDGVVLNREGETRKVNHPCAEFDVAPVQGRAAQLAHRPLRVR